MTRNLADYVVDRALIESWRNHDDSIPPRIRLSTGGTLILRGDVPKTRGDCPVERPCGHVKCRYHLWMLMPEDRPGRRRARIPPTLRPAWLESPLPSSCALDVANRVAISPVEEQGQRVKQLARDYGVAPSRWREIVQIAREKIAKLGVDAELLTAGG